MSVARFRKHALAAGLALLIFASGVVVGVALGHTSFAPFSDARDPWDRPHAEHLEAFRDHLDLTDEQTARVDEIMQRTRIEAEAIHAEKAPAMTELHERAHREILELLDEEQAVEYKRMIDHYMRRMQEEHRTLHWAPRSHTD
jgi:Spy/CpxP family protein refolding chaperone